MRFMVCGGAGYVGSALTAYLRAHGHTVDVVDLGWFGHIDQPRDYGDLTAVDMEGVDVVVSLAGHTSVELCDGRWSAAWQNNVDNLKHLLELSDGRQVIWASSSSVYGRYSGLAREDSPLEATNEYDRTKRAAEELALDSGHPVVCLRLGTVCGPAPNMRIDTLLNRMVYDALNEHRVQVTRTDFWRPVLDLQDLCRAIEAIALDIPRTAVYNMASFNARLHALGFRVAALCDVPLEIMDRDGSPYSMRLDTTAFQRDYGFCFAGTLDSLVQRLRDAWPTVEEFGTRRVSRDYARPVTA